MISITCILNIKVEKRQSDLPIMLYYTDPHVNVQVVLLT